MASQNDRVILTRLSYVVYEHPDLDKFRTFAKHFGLHEVDSKDTSGVVFFGGYGKDQYVYIAHQAPSGGQKAFLGAGFSARSAKDIELAQNIPGAQAVDIADRPGAGQLVRVQDVNGYFIEVVHDQTESETPEHGLSAVEGGRAVLNGALDKQRKGKEISCICWSHD